MVMAVNKILGDALHVYFDDGRQISHKDGEYLGETNAVLFMKDRRTGVVQGIPFIRIFRIEASDGREYLANE